MARLVQRLTEAKIRALTNDKIGLHHDGAGLYLQIRPGGAWIYRFRLNNRTRDMGPRGRQLQM